MKFTIVAFGRTKFPFVSDGLEHYFEQIRHHAEVDFIELKDQGSDKKRESEHLLDALKKRRFLDDGKTRIFLLDEKGKQSTSRDFATQIRSLQEQGVHRFVYLVGGAFGFTDELRTRFPLLSLSKMTFPHDLVRLLLAEQLYRALQIMTGGKYHHD